MTTSTEPHPIVYVSDDYFPPDDTDVEARQRTVEGGLQNHVTTPNSGDASPLSTSRDGHLDSTDHAAHTGNSFDLPTSFREAAAALEAYVFSEAAARDVGRLGWVPLPNATQRRTQLQLRACMQGQSPFVALGNDGDGAASVKAEEYRQATHEPKGTRDASPRDEEAGTRIDHGRVSDGAARSACSSGALADNRCSSSVGTSHPASVRGFELDQLPQDCWIVLDGLTAPQICEERSTLFVLAAVFSFVSHHLQAWVAATAAASVEGVNHASLTHAMTNGTISASQALATSPHMSGPGTTSLFLTVPLSLLYTCSTLLAALLGTVGRTLQQWLLTGTATSSSSFHPAKDSLMGALATNARWRMHVEVMLVCTAALLLLISAVVALRYRKYTRTMELWQVIEARHNAAEAKAWVAEMERRAVHLPRAEMNRSGVWGKSSTFPPVSHVFHSSSTSRGGAGGDRPATGAAAAAGVAAGGQDGQGVESNSVSLLGEHLLHEGPMNGVARASREEKPSSEAAAPGLREASETTQQRRVSSMLPTPPTLLDAPATLARAPSMPAPTTTNDPLKKLTTSPRGRTSPPRIAVPTSLEDMIHSSTRRSSSVDVRMALPLDVPRLEDGEERSGTSVGYHSTTRLFDDAESTGPHPVADGVSVLHRFGSSLSNRNSDQNAQ